MAEEFLAKLIDDGDIAGLVTEGLFRRIHQARSGGEKFEVSRIEESLDADERRWVYEALLQSVDSPDRAQVAACVRALKRRRLERERDVLQSQIQAAEREKDSPRLAKLLGDKTNLAKELAKLKGA